MPSSTRPTALALLEVAAFTVFTAAAADPPALPSVEHIIAKLDEADTARSNALLGYTATRDYLLVNERFKKRAQMIVRVRYAQPGHKSFEVLSQNGSSLLCDRVLKRVIKAEEDGSQRDSRQMSRISSANYRLRVIGTEKLRDRDCYVLELEPVSKSPYLVRGRAWIDRTDYAVVRLEGHLAKRPSIWLGTPKITQDYVKQERFWLPTANSSITDAPIFGRTSLRIETSGYEVRAPADPARATQ